MPVPPPAGADTSRVCDVCGGAGAWVGGGGGGVQQAVCGQCRTWRRFPNVSGALDPRALPAPAPHR